MSYVCDLNRSNQQEEFKWSFILVVLNTSSDEFKNVAQLELEIFIFENEKVDLESLLDDQDVEIGNFQKRLEVDTNEFKLLEPYLMNKVKMV